MKPGLRLLAVVILAVSWSPTCAQDKEKSKAAEPVKVPSELLEKRVESARQVFKGKFNVYNASGQGSPPEWIVWSRRIMDAELALHPAADRPDADARIKIYRDHLDRVRQIEKLMERLFQAKTVSPLDVEEVTYHRLDAEILLVQAGGKLP